MSHRRPTPEEVCEAWETTDTPAQAAHLLRRRGFDRVDTRLVVRLAWSLRYFGVRLRRHPSSDRDDHIVSA